MKAISKSLIFKIFTPVRTGLPAVCLSALWLLMIMTITPSLPTVQAGGLRPVHARHALVVSVHEDGSKAGVAGLQKGGNAVDAAGGPGLCRGPGAPPARHNRRGGVSVVGMGAVQPPRF